MEYPACTAQMSVQAAAERRKALAVRYPARLRPTVASGIPMKVPPYERKDGLRTSSRYVFGPRNALPTGMYSFNRSKRLVFEGLDAKFRSARCQNHRERSRLSGQACCLEARHGPQRSIAVPFRQYQAIQRSLPCPRRPISCVPCALDPSNRPLKGFSSSISCRSSRHT